MEGIFKSVGTGASDEERRPDGLGRHQGTRTNGHPGLGRILLGFLWK